MWIFAALLLSCVALGKLSNLSETQFPHQKAGIGAGLGPGVEMVNGVREGLCRGCELSETRAVHQCPW